MSKLKTVGDFFELLCLSVEEKFGEYPIYISMQEWGSECSTGEWVALTGMKFTISGVMHLRERLHRRHLAQLKSIEGEDNQESVDAKHAHFIGWFDAFASKHGHIITEDAIREHERAQSDLHSKTSTIPD